ncbi:MAG: VWA domain-containing protein [Thermoguttaceae bacterium]|jgi:uncharacterized membrane protein
MNGTLSNWMEHLLGLEARAGEGTAWRLESSWAWPPWVTLLLAVFAVLFVLGIYVREGRQTRPGYRMVLAGMRLALLAIVAAMIAQLTLSFQRTGLPYVAVLVDDSLSMTIVDRYEERIRAALEQRLKQGASPGDSLSRWNLAKSLLTGQGGRMLSSITEKYKLKVYFLTGARPSHRTDVAGIVDEIRATQPGGESTRLGIAVRNVLDDLRGAAPAAIVLVTDGINTEGPSLAEAAAYARRKGVLLFFVGLGSDRPVRDLKLSDLLVDDVVFVNDIVTFQCKLTGVGFQGTKVPVLLRQQGKPEVLAKVEVTVGPDGHAREVRVPYRPTEAGQFRYTVEVPPQEGEVQTENNRLARTVQVRKQKLRVLLAQAYPSFEFRFLRNMLSRDDTIELSIVLQDADVEWAEQDKTALRVFPIRRDELFSYDAIILGDVNPALLSTTVLQDLADFVDQPGKGGAMVFIAGPKYMPQAFANTPLARLLPFDVRTIRLPDPTQSLAQGFVVQPTELGLAGPAMQLGDTPEEARSIWQNLPPLYWMVEVPDLKPAARVLAEHPTRSGSDGRRLPLIVAQYVGAGKVLFHATDETYRWRRRVGDVYFARYWVQMLRYLCRSKLAEGRAAELSSNRRQYTAGDAVRLRVRFADERLAPPEDDGVTVVVEHQGHKTERLRLRRAETARGTFEGTLERVPLGAYHAWIAVPTLEGRSPAVDFSVVPSPGEFARVEMDAPAMREAAELTNGRFYTPATADRLLADLPEGRQVPIETLPPLPLWNRWPVLLLFLVLLIGEWLLRKRGGMV